jgi:hypothetical protein
MAGIKNFKRGDTKPITLTFTDKNNQPINLTGATLWFTVKKNPLDSDADAVIQKQITNHIDPINGISSVIITPEDTENLDTMKYYYDFQLVDPSGNVTTVLEDTFKLERDITRSR